MRLLFDDLLEIYRRWDDQLEADEYTDSWMVNGEAHRRLRILLLKIVDPKTVGDVMVLPVSSLRRWALVDLIKRDASNTYDQVDGFGEMVFCDEKIEASITTAQYDFDGLKLCEWIEEKFPYASQSESEIRVRRNSV